MVMTFAEIEGGAKANLWRVSILFFGPAVHGPEGRCEMLRVALHDDGVRGLGGKRFKRYGVISTNEVLGAM